MEKILIVDDKPDNIALLEQLLEDEGYDILPAISAEEALDIVSKENIDIILLDIMMPDMDGFELCNALKSDAKATDIPIIFMTALGEATDRVKGLHLGAVDYIVKPFDLDEALARVRIHLRIRAAEKLLQEQNKKLSETVGELADANRQLEFLSLMDSLMGILNRRGLDMELNDIHKRSARYNYNYSILIVDVDHFKLYNDTYGHQAGDEVLRRVAAILKETSRDTDVIGRYGGEEICIGSLGTTRQTAKIHAERARNTVWQTAIPHSASLVSDRVTVSIGVSYFEPGCGYSLAQMIQQADIALYQAKEKGRNTIVVYEEE